MGLLLDDARPAHVLGSMNRTCEFITYWRVDRHFAPGFGSHSRPLVPQFSSCLNDADMEFLRALKHEHEHDSIDHSSELNVSHEEALFWANKCWALLCDLIDLPPSGARLILEDRCDLRSH